MRRRKAGGAKGYQAYHGRRHPLRAVLLILLLLALLGGGVYCYARFVEPRMLRTEHLTVSDARVTQPLRIAAVADLHIGRGCGAARVAEVMDAVTALEPDAVVFLGDLFDDYSRYTEGDEALLSELLSPAALRGVPKYAVWGNHDLGGGAAFAYAEVLENAGWTLLKNQRAALPGNINLIGADDLIWGKPDTQGLVTDGAFNLLLCHEPDYAEEVSGVQLQLSGHTHGLQINLPIRAYQDRIAPRGGVIYRSGRYEKADGSTVYVSRGVGMSLYNYRFNAVPELTLVEVTP